jgi:hypothetical protein
MSEKESAKIRDIAKFKKMREEMRAFKMMKRILPFASPILKIFGVDTKQMKEAFSDFDKLEEQFLDLSEFPDKFNDVFSSRGWIIYDFLNLDTAKEALEIAQTDIDAAEQFLVDYYSPENIEWLLRTMNGVRAFRPRMELAELAFIDYREKRYHACVPVILSLMDGLVNELNRQQNRGLFSEDSDLSAWDCITAHEKGINALKKVLFAGRYKTTIEEISIPYRNGILHGTDLGYANKMVAAKTWAALFAVRDWAVKAEGKMLFEPPLEPQPTWTSLANQIKENSEWRSNWEILFNNWQPRNIIIGKDISKTGELLEFQNETPESKVGEFLCYWKKKNYGNMSKCLQSSFTIPINKLALQVRERYQQSQLIDFELIEIRDKTASFTEVDTLLTYEQDGQIFKKSVEFQVGIYDDKFNTSISGMPNSNWFITLWISV